jgi:hypothetical protein
VISEARSDADSGLFTPDPTRVSAIGRNNTNSFRLSGLCGRWVCVTERRREKIDPTRVRVASLDNPQAEVPKYYITCRVSMI